MESNPLSLKSNEVKSSFSSSSSSKNEGKKRKHKEHRKILTDQGFASKRPCLGISSAEETSNYGTPDSTKKPEVFATVSPLQDLFKSGLFNQKIEKDSRRHDNQDTIMADQTTKSASIPFIAQVRYTSDLNSDPNPYLLFHC
jgi:hypothetical protein